MPYVEKEQIQKAREVDLLSYLRAYEPDELVHISGENYCTRTHDSLKISNGKWHWFSRGIGGKTALDYLIKVKGYKFVEAVEKVVKANAAWVPPYGSGATLYIRPYMFGSNPVIGVKPADEYQFRIFCTPVGPYFKGGAKPITIRVCDYDRAAPHGTGHIKAGLNYAMSLHAIVEAHKEGYDENMYLDAATRTYVEETGGANFLFITKDGTVVTPKSGSILPSITRRSLCYVAEHILGMKVEHRKVALEEVKDFAECGLCGTAAVISPVGKIVDHGKEICFPSGMEEMGPVIKKLYDTLTGIQMGTVEGPEGWVHEIKVD